MKEEELKEDRKLILDFLAWETYELKSRVHLPEINFSVTMYKVPMKFNLPFSHCRFHEDWNLLMLVVEKIESTVLIGRKSIRVHIYSNCCDIQEINFNTDTKDYYVDMVLGSKIESVYHACLCFIKWYNTQEK